MPDHFGGVDNPIDEPASSADAVSDPALDVLLGYCRDVLNDKAGDAWATVAPGKEPVRAVYAHDPEKVWIRSNELPALFAYRMGGGAPYDMASDVDVAEDTVTMVWVFGREKQAIQRLQSPIISGLCRTLGRALRRGRESAYVNPGDSDPEAATLASLPTAIKLSVATSTSAASYSGGALNESVGIAAISPPRPVTITLVDDPDDPGQIDVGSTVTVTGTNALGAVVTSALTVAGPGTLTTARDFATVTTIDVEPQAGTTGTLRVGLGAFAGLGTVILRAMDAMAVRVLKQGTPRLLTLRMFDDSKPITFACIEFQFTLQQALTLDPAEYAQMGTGGGSEAGTGVEVTFTREDETEIQTALF